MCLWVEWEWDAEWGLAQHERSFSCDQKGHIWAFQPKEDKSVANFGAHANHVLEQISQFDSEMKPRLFWKLVFKDHASLLSWVHSKQHTVLPCQPGLSIQSSAVGTAGTPSLHYCHRWLHFHSSLAADIAQSLAAMILSPKWALEVCVCVPVCRAGSLSPHIQVWSFGGWTKS